jgi:hypothetical protein
MVIGDAVYHADQCIAEAPRSAEIAENGRRTESHE